ncbi:MAG: hypothetical protein M0P47_11960 [Bacteroidales bacterium]|nr:hypothetical protein [Bacteroidales bacterium]
MNKKFLIKWGAIPVLALLLNFSGNTQVVFSEWLSGTGTRGWDLVNDMTCDVAGNIYITGSFTDTIVKSGPAGRATNSGRLMYVAKFDTSGKLIWNKNILNVGAGFGSLIAQGSNSQLILAGGVEISNQRTGIQTGKSGFFLSSLNDQGMVNWTQNFTGSKLDYLTSLIVDTLRSEILITGYFHDTLRIGEKKLISSGATDGVFLWFDITGTLKDAWVIGGKAEDKLSCVAIDSLGNRILAGIFQQKIQFGKTSVLELNNHRDQGLFAARQNHDGVFNSLKLLATGKKIKVSSIMTFGEGCIVAGSFSDNMSLGNQMLHAVGGDDVFILCLDQKLQIAWVKQIGGEKKDRISEILNIGKEVILTGSFNSSITIDHQKLTATGNSSDVFIIALDFSGNLKWMRKAGGKANDYPTCMVPGPKGYIYLAGSYRQTFNLNEKSLESVGEEDVFIGRLENCKVLAPDIKRPVYFCEDNRVDLDAGDGFISYDWNNGFSHEQTITVDQGGIVTLELIAANGCILYDTIGVSEVLKPVVNLGNDTTIADTSRILLHTGGKYSHYLWNNGNIKSDNLIKGIELHEGPNLVKVSVTNDQGCIGG